MENAHFFRDKIDAGKSLVGTAITFSDSTVTESLANILDFVWIDTEHTPLSLESVQGHIMATKGSELVPIVRVANNDAVLIKPVLDIGAAGVIVPLVKTADDVRCAVAACRYPPEGVRGYGPRRPTQYGKFSGPEFCSRANASVITIVQIEQNEALTNLRDILAVPNLTSIVVGPNDLAAALGFVGQPRHPEVLSTIDHIIRQARQAHVPVGIAAGGGPEVMVEWFEKGMQWISVATDYNFLMRSASEFTQAAQAVRR
ncbi:MAG: aldolase/citrate lyase family protein [Planctomycetota bacterium]|nr:aldolase/citrate lyase family protein [Planctomycetota bacterium]MDA1177900.1 aldolase/citrate lyase family protein [Planctomycetota bacterium]